jgi:hypothetical protein
VEHFSEVSPYTDVETPLAVDICARDELYLAAVKKHQRERVSKSTEFLQAWRYNIFSRVMLAVSAAAEIISQYLQNFYHDPCC